jgi:opacity protein-like surface antigen
MRSIAVLLLVACFVTTSANAQSGITIEPFAGISIPTDSDFSDGFKTGMALGGRFGYAVTDNIDVTAAFSFNRFGADTEAFLKAGGIAVEVDYDIIGVRVGGRYSSTPSGSLGFRAMAEAGMASQKLKSDFGSSDSETDPAVAVGVGGQYYFTPTASVAIGPTFNMIFAEESYHFLDIVASVVFGF